LEKHQGVEILEIREKCECGKEIILKVKVVLSSAVVHDKGGLEHQITIEGLRVEGVAFE
jgi:hypothetical protein